MAGDYITNEIQEMLGLEPMNLLTVRNYVAAALLRDYDVKGQEVLVGLVRKPVRYYFFFGFGPEEVLSNFKTTHGLAKTHRAEYMLKKIKTGTIETLCPMMIGTEFR